MSEWKASADDLESIEAAKIAFKQGNSHSDVVNFYTEWVKDGKYMKDTEPERYRAHILACEGLEAHFPQNRDKVKIIDVGAGTGRAGVLLVEMGFRDMDALEPCTEMLEEAEKLKIYGKHLCKPIGFDRLPIEDNTYDLAVVAGAMGEGHIPCEGVKEMNRIVKPGGIISIAMRQEFLDTCTDYQGRLEPLMKQMEDNKEWKLVSREIKPNYYCHKPGLVLRYSPL